MRASIRGSIRNEIATDSAESPLLPANADSINRRSGRFSAQKLTSPSSLSKRGTSSQVAKARIIKRDGGECRATFQTCTARHSVPHPSLIQRLVHLPLVKISFLRLEWPGQHHPDLLPIRAIHTENPYAPRGHSQVKVPGLHRKSRRTRQ